MTQTYQERAFGFARYTKPELSAMPDMQHLGNRCQQKGTAASTNSHGERFVKDSNRLPHVC
jgi:hypothetical protein